MSYHVLKFGGSNLKEKDDILRVVDVIRKYDSSLIIVVSAFYGVTDMLIDALEKVKKDEQVIKTLSDSLISLKNETLKEVIDNSVVRDTILINVVERIKKLERYLQGVNFFGDTPSFVNDSILSYGERLSSLMLTGILNYYGIEAEEMLPEDLGLITDGEFGNATLDFEATSKNIKSKLGSKKIVVVPGFYGVSPEGKTTLFGRGGSDYSAAAIANCVNAKSLDLFKDVDGFLSADPRYVSHPRRIKTLSYMESAELSYFGAKILHPRTVEPLREANIPIRLYNITNVGSLDEPLTSIENTLDVHDDVIKSVTFSDEIGILKLKGPGVGYKPRNSCKSILSNGSCRNKY